MRPAGSGGGPTNRPAAEAGEAPLEARFETPSPIDLALSLDPLSHGPADPTIKFGHDGVWLARRTQSGPATIRIWTAPGGDAVLAQAWGPGAEAALTAVPGLAGLLDNPPPLVGQHALIHELDRQFAGLRLPRTGQLTTALVPAVIGQKVTAGEAHASYLALIRRAGEPAPGPAGMCLPPASFRVAALPYFEFHPMGLERRRAEVLRHICGLEVKIEGWLSLPPDEARAKLRLIPGIGPWTAAEATREAFGDPDAVSVGDAHIPHLVSWALAGEPRGDDARMLELLAPYEGQRGRVIRLLEAARIKIPRFGPRFSPGHIERL